ncbi:MAG: ABC transporter permease [Acidobacteriaceae bacterium]
MLQSVPASSTSTSRTGLLRSAWQAAAASWKARFVERYGTVGTAGYIVIWLVFPIFTLATTGLIYRGVRPDLLQYSVVGIAASAFITNSLYYVGQVLDEERWKGTLGNLFLAPCPRLGWLTGFAFGGLLETILSSLTAVAFGMLAFGVRFNPDFPALFLALALFVVSLWGLGFVFSALGLVLKRSNDLANLLSPFVILLGGVYFPVTLLPVWLRIPAHALPFGYGVQAMASASLHHTGITELRDQLLPLAGFAVVLPIMGVLTFRWLERKVRSRGELDLY